MSASPTRQQPEGYGEPSVTRRALGRLMVGAGALRAAAPLWAQAPALPIATNLRAHLEAAAARQQPLVVMVSLAGCPYCKVAREHYLFPMWRQSAISVVQVDMRSAQVMTDLKGQPITHDKWVEVQKIRIAPTLLFFGKGGTEVAERLVGGYLPDFYGAYLTDRLETAQKAL